MSKITASNAKKLFYASKGMLDEAENRPQRGWVMSLGDFEATYKTGSPRETRQIFVFARYKGRWVAAIADFGLCGSIDYRYFHNNQNGNVLLSECILMVNVPEPPQEQS